MIAGASCLYPPAHIRGHVFWQYVDSVTATSGQLVEGPISRHQTVLDAHYLGEPGGGEV